MLKIVIIVGSVLLIVGLLLWLLKRWWEKSWEIDLFEGEEIWSLLYGYPNDSEEDLGEGLN